ncbi:MAG: hypothetical protein RIQ81_862 [Pseudomonadota bacterium]
MSTDKKAAAGDKSKQDPKLRYAHMVVYLRRRASLLTWCIGAGMFLGLLVYPLLTGMVSHWTSLLPPILAVGLATLTIPLSEEWEYTPWQAEPERYEHYNRD